MTHIKWEENSVNNVLYNKLNWKKPDGIESSWRSDCYIALLKLYLYRELLGYNDKECGLSALILDGQISREDALQRLKREKYIPEQVLENLLGDFSISFGNLHDIISRYKKF